MKSIAIQMLKPEKKTLAIVSLRNIKAYLFISPVLYIKQSVKVQTSHAHALWGSLVSNGHHAEVSQSPVLSNASMQKGWGYV